MADPAIRRERRVLLGFAMLAVALIVLGIVSAMLLTADEPRRGEGMIPPPIGDVETPPEATPTTPPG